MKILKVVAILLKMILILEGHQHRKQMKTLKKSGQCWSKIENLILILIFYFNYNLIVNASNINLYNDSGVMIYNNNNSGISGADINRNVSNVRSFVPIILSETIVKDNFTLITSNQRNNNRPQFKIQVPLISNNNNSNKNKVINNSSNSNAGNNSNNNNDTRNENDDGGGSSGSGSNSFNFNNTSNSRNDYYQSGATEGRGGSGVGGMVNGGTGGGGSSNSINTYNVYELVRNLDIRLKNIRNFELGVTIIQEIFDAMDFTTIIRNDREIVGKFAKRITKKLEKAITIINKLDNLFTNNITILLKSNQNDDDDYDRNNEEIKQTTRDSSSSSSSSSNNNNEDYTRFFNISLNTLIHPCPPFEDVNFEQTYNRKQIQILNYLKYTGQQYTDDENDLNFTINAKIMEEIRYISKNIKYFKHVYFLSRNDFASDHNCQYYFNDIHFRYLFVSAIKRKHVFLLIDHGNAFNSEQMELTKTFVSYILNILSFDDTITIATISDKFKPMHLDNYYKNTNNDDDLLYMYPVTMDNKMKILDFINKKLNQTIGITNHTLAFEQSFLILEKQNITRDRPIQFLYITRGLLTHLTEGLNVLTTISRLQKNLQYPIIINTCAVVLDERRIMYEKQFLRDIAEQNYTKYNINISSWSNHFHHYHHQYYHHNQKQQNYNDDDDDDDDIRGRMFVVTKRHLERIIKTSTAIFETIFKKKYLTNGISYHLPAIDYNTKDVIISITKTVKSFGVIGVNMYLADLAEDVIYFKPSGESYAFLIDINGTVIYHPAFPRPIATVHQPFPVDIFYLENCTNFKAVRNEILIENYGNATCFKGNNNNNTITYTWQRILNVYIICIVTKIKNNGKLPGQLVHVVPAAANIRNYQHTGGDFLSSSELLYHRIDLLPPQTPVCRHFRQIATLDSGTIFLSASSFQSPFVYIRNDRENREEIRMHNAQSIVAYLKDITNLLANPGLQPQIRNDVTALHHVMSYLKKRHQESGTLRKYIIRRYVATINGVLQVYPGCVLGTDLEPSLRPWYRKAMKHSGKIVITEPYLDAGGAGYVITIAHTIFEGKANALHNAERDVPVAIVAIDVPYAFFYKIVLDSTHLCTETNIKCLLIENEGYLIAHPSFMEPSTSTRNNRRPLEHITHKESFVANDILNHKKLVQKKVCANYQNRSIQRYYMFNTSLTEVFTNVAHGDRTKYQITAIRGTNLFAAVLNSTCDGGAFCPCSTVDRVCLNCNRMDQTDCECPCECPLKIPDKFNNESFATNSSILLHYCEPPVEDLSVVNSLSYDWNMVLKSCININCDVYTTQTECLGIMGCEWCQLDIDGNSFNTPFCAAQSSCFNGVLGSVTPYGDGDLGSAIVEPSSPPAYSVIGPVGGAIIALCLVVGFAMYCYRQNLDNSSEQFYAESMQEDNYGVPLSRFNFDDISPHDDSDLSGGGGGGGVAGLMHRNLLNSVGNAIAVSDISPYHMSSGGYRRPNGESDHGYSTMTPHEDSEHMCFTLVEPLINNKRLSMSDSMSINTSVSSPTSQQNHGGGIMIDNNRRILPPPATTALPGESAAAAAAAAAAVSVGVTTKDFLYTPEQTIIHEQLSPHHILAPVTVHRHMEAS